MCQLLDERSRPDFRDLYGKHASEAGALSAAVRRIRLGGIDLGSGEISNLRSLRLLMGEVSALDLSNEAETLAADPQRRPRLFMLAALLEDGRLQVRIAPLAGWAPDFSVFLPPAGSPAAPILMLGTHWFERPFPHPGPAFGVVTEGRHALTALRRFNETWARAHEIHGPLQALITEALSRTAERTPTG